MTNLSLLVASILTVGVGLVHSWLGEVRLIGPLVAPGKRLGILEKSAFARGVLRFAWHLTTVAWWGFAAILVVLAQTPVTGQGRIVLMAIALMFAMTGMIALIASRGRHLAWPVFMAIAGLALVPVW